MSRWVSWWSSLPKDTCNIWGVPTLRRHLYDRWQQSEVSLFHLWTNEKLLDKDFSFSLPISIRNKLRPTSTNILYVCIYMDLCNKSMGICENLGLLVVGYVCAQDLPHCSADDSVWRVVSANAAGAWDLRYHVSRKATHCRVSSSHVVPPAPTQWSARHTYLVCPSNFYSLVIKVLIVWN